MIDATCEITHRNGGFWYARVRYNRIITNPISEVKKPQWHVLPVKSKDEMPSTAFVSSNHLKCRNPEKRPKQA